MTAPTDLSINDRIAMKKGWTWYEKPQVFADRYGARWFTRHWRNPEGQPAIRPDFVGTLEGVAGLLSELQRGQCWVWIVNPEGGTGTQYTIENPTSCFRIDATAPLYPPRFDSPRDRPGDCVGDAYLSMKEAEDAT